MEKSDLDALFSLDSDPQIREFFPTGVLNLEQVAQKIEMNQNLFKTHGFCDFIMEDAQTKQFLGRAGFGPLDDDVEMGYLLLKEFWGLGYASEALNGLIKWGFENLSYERLIALAPLDHLASQKVIEKCGMVYFKIDSYQNTPCRFYEVKKTGRKA
jgi:RimJ/RimL family protein N-acetyltransferase